MTKMGLEFGELYSAVKTLQQNGCVFQYYEDDVYDGRKITINKREMLHLSNCSDLGIETHPLLIAGATEAVKKYGTQNSVSRAMLSSPLYRELEERLGSMFPGYHAIFPTTTLAHCSALPQLIQSKDAIILDAHVHNSVRMASQLCKANGTFTILSRHNDLEHVRYLIYRLRKEGYARIWYCADGLYSIHGNFCDIKGLVNLLDSEDNFYAYVDDAHSTGWYGKTGCGFVASQGRLHEKMIVAESLNKSMAGGGALIIASDPEVIEYLKFTGQTMIFSGPIQPANLGALNASVKLHLSEQFTVLQSELMELIEFFILKSKELQLPLVTDEQTPIKLFRIGSMEKMIRILLQLISAGFLPMTAGYPAVARGEEGIRVNITRHLNKKDISGFLETLKEILLKEDK
jgi:7-keto-8-aminopelargonate synthetase-like enzyme